jgi:hypothetical protein
MANRLLVDSLITEVRSLIGETNTDGALDDTTDILPALNSALIFAVGILARHYAAPLMTSTTISTISGTSSYAMPEDAVEDRIRSCEGIIQTGTYEEILPVDAAMAGQYDQATTIPVPYCWHVEERNLIFTPTPSGAYNIRVKYPKMPPLLAKKWGKITFVDATTTVAGNNLGAGYIRVDAISEDASIDVSSENAFVSLVDGQTGRIKGVMQMAAIVEGTTTVVSFKPSPDRTTIETLTVSTSIASMSIQVGDYIAPAPYTCICTLREPTSGFIVRHAGMTLNEPLGGDNQILLKVTSDFEKLVQSTWVGQPARTRVKFSSLSWGRAGRIIRPTQRSS